MEPDETMEAIINRVHYRVAGSTVLAHDCYWDGHNFERRGRNTYLYRSQRGRYFAVHLTQWQGERDQIEPLELEEAYDLYENLPEKALEVEKAFPGRMIVNGKLKMYQFWELKSVPPTKCLSENPSSLQAGGPFREVFG